MQRTLACLMLSMLLGANASSGAIVSATGPVTLAVPTGMTTSLPSMQFYAWDEQTNVTFSGQSVSTTTNPSNSPYALSTSFSGQVNSHYLHMTTWRAVPGLPASLTCTITFDQPIVAAITWQSIFLNQTDAACSVTPGQFPVTMAERGFFDGFGNVSINGNTLTVTVAALGAGFYDPVDQMRVFTAVPAPGSVALAGLGGALLCRRRGSRRSEPHW